MHSTIAAPRLPVKRGLQKAHIMFRLQTPWLIQHCHFLEVQDIYDHSSGTNIVVLSPCESSEKMAFEIGQ